MALVSRHRSSIHCDGSTIIANPHIDVRGHVQEMPGALGNLLQTPGGREAALRSQTSVEQMNVIVIRAKVTRVSGKYRFQNPQSFGGRRVRIAVTRPHRSFARQHQTLDE
jgi:hypothetical protein